MKVLSVYNFTIHIQKFTFQTHPDLQLRPNYIRKKDEKPNYNWSKIAFEIHRGFRSGITQNVETQTLQRKCTEEGASDEYV